MDVALGFPALVTLIGIALIFDMLNGLHDAANSIATVVSTRVLPPQYAVAWAAFFNFIAFLFFGLNVAHTVGTGIVSADVVDTAVIFGALSGAIAWNLITWWWGIPSSSSHALIGGLAGAGFMKAGVGAIVWSGLGITAAAIVFSPLLGFALALLLVLIVSWVFLHSTPVKVDNLFRILQFASAALYSLGHGGNDAQKTMGIIAVLLFSQGMLGETFYVPFWVILSCQGAMALGTLLGGWRIVHTLGSRITRLHPVQGFCAEAGGAATLFIATAFGVPVSTTHTITGAIVGVGAAHLLHTMFDVDGALVGYGGLAPEPLIEMIAAGKAKDYAKARAIHDRLLPVTRTVYHRGSHMEGTVALKHGLVTRGILEHATVRPPLLPLESGAELEIAEALRSAGLVPQAQARGARAA